MASLHSNHKVWDFYRSAKGQISLHPREACAPHWIGEGKSMEIIPNQINTSVAMIRLAQTYHGWGEGLPLAVVGEVAAGRYDVTVAYCTGPDAAEVLLLPPEWARSGYFALRVRGNSMQEAGIHAGDYVVIRPQSNANNGDMVIAGLADAEDPEGYVTLKQFFREQDHVRLQPANACMAPIHLYPQWGQDPIEIQGKVVAVVRLEEEDWLE